MHQAQIGWRRAGQQLRRDTRCHLLGFLVKQIERRYRLADEFSIAKSGGGAKWNCCAKNAGRDSIFVEHRQEEQFTRILHLIQGFSGEVYDSGVVIGEHLVDQGKDGAAMCTVPHVQEILIAKFPAKKVAKFGSRKTVDNVITIEPLKDKCVG